MNPSTDTICLRTDLHVKDEPEGYIAWHDWARRKNWTHRQKRCPGCGLFKVWVPRTSPTGEAER